LYELFRIIQCNNASDHLSEKRAPRYFGRLFVGSAEPFPKRALDALILAISGRGAVGIFVCVPRLLLIVIFHHGLDILPIVGAHGKRNGMQFFASSNSFSHLSTVMHTMHVGFPTIGYDPPVICCPDLSISKQLYHRSVLLYFYHLKTDIFSQ
jgi:hypothetical protein